MWVSHPNGHYDNDRGDGVGDGGSDGVSNKEQESKMQLRLLPGNLLHYFSSLFLSVQSDHSYFDNGTNNIDNIDNNIIVSFENELYYVFKEDYRITNDTTHSSASRINSTQTYRAMAHGDTIL